MPKIKQVLAEHAGVREPVAVALFDKLEMFAGYAFNRSHAAEYALISWWTMWLKVYFPAEFYAGSLSIIDKDEKLAPLMLDAQIKGLRILPPDINISTDRIAIKGDTLYAPFQSVKGVSIASAQRIVKLRTIAVDGKITSPAHLEALSIEGPKGTRKLVVTVMNNLKAVGAFHSADGEGPAATHPDRLRDRLTLMPGFTVDAVKADRTLNLEVEARNKVIQIIADSRACSSCDLQTQPHPMPQLGTKAKFMVVVDTPSWKEGKLGKMLMGDTGDVLKAVLKDVGLQIADGYFTSLVKAPKVAGVKSLTNEQINGCTQFLKREIDLLKPQVIVALGSNALRYFAPAMKGNPSDLAGSCVYRQDLDATIVVGGNPASVFFDPKKADGLITTFAKVAELIS